MKPTGEMTEKTCLLQLKFFGLMENGAVKKICL